MHSIIRKVSAVAIIGVFSGFALQASAATVKSMTTPELPSRTINVAEFDVDSVAGAEKLYQSIRTAARRACSEEHDVWYNKARTYHRNLCIDTAVAQAVATLNLPLLTDLHRGTADSELVARR